MAATSILLFFFTSSEIYTTHLHVAIPAQLVGAVAHHVTWCPQLTKQTILKTSHTLFKPIKKNLFQEPVFWIFQISKHF